MATNQVAVTGLGAMTGLGLDLASTWEGLIAGRSPVRPFRLFNPDGLPVTFGVELPEGAEELFAGKINPRHRSQMTRGTMMAVVTARMALADSGLDANAMDRNRVGVVVGSTGTGYVPPPAGADEQRILRGMSSSPAAWIAIAGKFMGPSFVVGTACSSAVYAMNSAFSLIESGRCDVVICGASDSSINYPDVQGFCSLLALAERQEDIRSACRPFDRNRTGFVIGEGAGFLVLESLAFARQRRARIYATMPPPGLSSEAYNILSPQRDGSGMAVAMHVALASAGLRPQDIDYIHAHGTSTRLNDLYETQAIKKVFGDRARAVPISSTKPMTGHCLAAAAGVESVICCMAIREGAIPPTINLTCPDPELDLDFVPNVARKKELRHVLCNSFAFGGHNGVSVFSKYE